MPFVLVALIFGTDIMTLLYERGEFTHELSEQTAALFTIYTFGIFGYICQELLNKLLYLDSRYGAPVIGSLAIILAKPLVNLVAVNYGVEAIAVTTTVLFFVYAVIIAVAITKVTGNYATAELLRNLLKIFAAGAAALGVWVIFRITGFDPIGGRTGFLLPLGACGVVYIAVIWASGLVKVLLPRRRELGEQHE